MAALGKPSVGRSSKAKKVSRLLARGKEGKKLVAIARSETVTRSLGRGKKLVVVQPEKCGMNSGLLRDYENAMQTLVKKKIMPGCASVVFRKNQCVQAKCWGYADCEARRPMKMDSMCRLFCMMKSYLALAFGTLVDEGKVDFEDRLDKYLPCFSNMRVVVKSSAKTEKTVKAKGPILLKHLLTHTSGIDYPVDVGNGDKAYNPQTRRYLGMLNGVRHKKFRNLEEFVNKLATFPLSGQPGGTYNYGYSFDVMGRVLEVITGKSLDVVMHERVFKPLGMQDTHWTVPLSKLNRLSACYAKIHAFKHLHPGEKPKGPGGELFRIDGGRQKDSAWAPGNACDVLSGGGFMGYHAGGGPVSTVADTVPFIRMLLKKGVLESGKRLLSKKTMAALEQNRVKKGAGSLLGAGQADKFCYMCNIGAFRKGGMELGMGGAACTYWSVDRKTDISTIWFAQHINMPDPTWDGPELLGGLDPFNVDLWKTCHKALQIGPEKRKSTLEADSKVAAKRAKV